MEWARDYVRGIDNLYEWIESQRAGKTGSDYLIREKEEFIRLKDGSRKKIFCTYLEKK